MQRITIDVQRDEALLDTGLMLDLQAALEVHCPGGYRVSARAIKTSSTSASNVGESRKAPSGAKRSRRTTGSNLEAPIPSKAEGKTMQLRIATIADWAKAKKLVVPSRWTYMHIARIAMPLEALVAAMEEIWNRQHQQVRSLQYFYTALLEMESNRHKALVQVLPNEAPHRRRGFLSAGQVGP